MKVANRTNDENKKQHKS